MTVRVAKPKFNLREKITELDKPSGLKGNELLRSDTAQEARNVIGAGRKNKVINGAMEISQRGTSFSSIGGTTEKYTLDRFKLQNNDLDQAVATVSQDSSAPDGFSKSLKIQCTTVESSVENYEHARLIYDGEAFDFTDVGFGTRSAKRITVSFWVKSNLTGTWGMNFWRGDANRSNLRTYTITNANTWEHKVITLSPDTTGGGVNNDNGYGFRINWGLATGNNFATAHALDTWHGFNNSYFYPYESRHTNFYSSTSNNFYLTGVQCEISDVATEFEHRSRGEELLLCQRYFETINLYGAHSNYTGGGYNRHTGEVFWKVEKRAIPTTNTPGVGNYQPGGGSGTVSISGPTINGGVLNTGNTNSTYPDGWINSGSILEIDAEL